MGTIRWWKLQQQQNWDHVIIFNIPAAALDNLQKRWKSDFWRTWKNFSPPFLLVVGIRSQSFWWHWQNLTSQFGNCQLIKASEKTARIIKVKVEKYSNKWICLKKDNKFAQKRTGLIDKSFRKNLPELTLCWRWKDYFGKSNLIRHCCYKNCLSKN